MAEPDNQTWVDSKPVLLLTHSIEFSRSHRNNYSALIMSLRFYFVIICPFLPPPLKVIKKIKTLSYL